MKPGYVTGAVIGLAALLSGCASMSSGSAVGASAAVDVTRFHLGADIARGVIEVEPNDASQAGTFDFNRYATAVERELTQLGWQVARGNARSEQVALVRVSQGTREQAARRPGLNTGIGGGFGAPSGRGDARAIVVTELAVRLQRRSDGTAIWEGRAQSEARGNSPMADPANAVDRLAAALFQGFPGESGRTIRVR